MLISSLQSSLAAGLEQYMQPAGYSLRVILGISLTNLAVTLILWIWSSVGILRSADRRIANGCGSGWAYAAKVSVALGTIAMVCKLGTSIAPDIVDDIKVVTGNDPLGSMQVRVSADGLTLTLRGRFGAGTAEKVETILEAARAVRTFELDSHGGRLLEAEHLAKVVRERRLDTYVDKQCESACTYVFLAGKDRRATPSARIGFHGPSTAGFGELRAELESMNRMSQIYRDDGIPDSFIQHAVNTAASDMWYPSRDELVLANVITRTLFVDEGECPDYPRLKD